MTEQVEDVPGFVVEAENECSQIKIVTDCAVPSTGNAWKAGHSACCSGLCHECCRRIQYGGDFGIPRCRDCGFPRA